MSKINYLEFSLAKHAQAAEALLKQFKAHLSDHEQKQLNRHIQAAEEDLKRRLKICRDEYNDEFMKIEKLKKEAVKKPHLTRMYERAEESLKNQCEKSLLSISEIFAQSIASLNAMR
jgi:methionine synthase II (cobalamin-independent)